MEFKKHCNARSPHLTDAHIHKSAHKSQLEESDNTCTHTHCWATVAQQLVLGHPCTIQVLLASAGKSSLGAQD